MQLITGCGPFRLLIAALISVVVSQATLAGGPSEVISNAKRKPQQREPERASRWRSLQLDVGHMNVMWPFSFHSSLNYWQSGELNPKGQWSIENNNDLKSPLSFATESTILIKGSCAANLALLQGGLVHIYGDVTRSIDIRGYGEIVVGGDIASGATIDTDGIQSMFIGGDVRGVIQSKGSLKLAIGGNLTGTVQTGTPRTEVRVRGNVSGQLKPTKEASLMSLEVDGYMSYGALEIIYRYNYTDFEADIGVSDRPPGIYPRRVGQHQVAGPPCCWTIHSLR
jgi:hypothetical protein